MAKKKKESTADTYVAPVGILVGDLCSKCGKKVPEKTGKKQRCKCWK